MSDFLFDLSRYYTGHLMAPKDEAYLKKLQRQDAMEDQIVKAFGLDFADEYFLLNCELGEWELTANFRAGIRFGLCLAEELRRAEQEAP